MHIPVHREDLIEDEAEAEDATGPKDEDQDEDGSGLHVRCCWWGAM